MCVYVCGRGKVWVCVTNFFSRLGVCYHLIDMLLGNNSHLQLLLFRHYRNEQPCTLIHCYIIKHLRILPIELMVQHSRVLLI